MTSLWRNVIWGWLEEARKYSEDWEAQEKDNPLAAAALIYSLLRMKD